MRIALIQANRIKAKYLTRIILAKFYYNMSKSSKILYYRAFFKQNNNLTVD